MGEVALRPQQVADYIHAFGVIVAHRANERQQFCTLTRKARDFQGLFVFLWVKNTLHLPLHLLPDLMDLNLRLQPRVEKIKLMIYCADG